MNKTTKDAAFQAAREIAHSCEAGAWVAVLSYKEALYGDGWSTPPLSIAHGGSYSNWEFRHGADKAWKWAPGLKREVYCAPDEYGIWEKED
jgi:hypothetical protein